MSLLVVITSGILEMVRWQVTEVNGTSVSQLNDIFAGKTLLKHLMGIFCRLGNT